MFGYAPPGASISPVNVLPVNWETPNGIVYANIAALDRIDLAELDWYPIIPGNQPSFDPATQILDQNLALIGGEIIQSWTVRSMTAGELLSYQNQVARAEASSAAALVEQIKASAKAALVTSDITILRCYEAGVPVPAEWHSYRVALRGLMATGASTLPSSPTYPLGT